MNARRIRVLVVEDNPRHAELIVDELADHGPYDCEVAATATEAVERAAAAPYDIILIDYRLPDEDGIELIRTLRTGGIDIPALFVTTANSVELAVTAMKAGADDYVVKQEGYLSILPVVVGEVLERARLRERSRMLEEQTRRAERLESLNALIAAVAHNFNNPLTTVQTFLDLLPTHYAVDEDFRTRFYSIACADVRRMRQLVEGIMSSARLQRQQEGPCRISELLDAASAFLEREAGHCEVRIEADLPADLPPVRGMSEALKQLLIILLDNAIHFSPPGEAVRVSARSEGGNGSGSPRVVLDVEDRGPGIPEEHLERIFDPFFTTRENGVGMGLYIAHTIVRAHGGSIEAINLRPRGARFRVVLPPRF